jgi:hypothetical protein
VTNLDDAGLGSLRDAIGITPSGGTVDFRPGMSGMITLITGELLIDKDLTIAGPGASLITVSGNHASRVFNVAAPFTVDISGLTIAQGRVTGTAANGGGIFNAGTLTVTDSAISSNYVSGSGLGQGHGSGIFNAGTLIVSNSTLSDNYGYPCFGGGIYNSGTLTVASSSLSDNFIYDDPGGGIFNDRGGTLTVTNSTLSGNAAGGGGGIANYGGTLTVTNSTLKRNGASYLGGGIFDEGAGTLTVTNSTLSDNLANSSSGYGGGIENEGGTLTVTNSTLSGNSAFLGGGIDNYGGSLTVTNSTLSGNHSNYVGGGINNFRTLTVTSSTISGNSARYMAGGIAGTLTAMNTIFAGNTAYSPGDVIGTLHSQGHNLIGDGTGGSGFADTDLVGTTDFPIDPLLEPLGDYGGPTQTMRPLPDSPVINAGDNTDAPDTDQRGFTRIVGGFIDIGAVELQPDEFGGPSGSSAAPLLLTRLPAERVAVAATGDASAFTASAAQTRSASVDRQRLDAFFAVLGGTREDHGQPEFLPHVAGRQTARPQFDTLFGGVAADDYRF